jgi:anti-sigma regulatory factor (Ser/Thr protein kinase)
MPSSVRELHIQADLKNLAIVAEFVSACCKHWRIAAKNTFDIQLAIDEAVTNIIEHAYAGKAGEVSLRCWVATHHFYVQLQDKGRPFNPADAPYPNITGSLAERRTGGLGIYFMRRLMDEVHFESNENKNVLQMVKYNVTP